MFPASMTHLLRQTFPVGILRYGPDDREAFGDRGGTIADSLSFLNGEAVLFALVDVADFILYLGVSLSFPIFLYPYPSLYFFLSLFSLFLSLSLPVYSFL